MTKNAAIYTRISQDPTGEKAGVKRQEEDCRALAERRGWTVGEVLCDNDVSAYSGKERPSYLALLDAVKNHEVEAVIAWHPDRLHRSPRELEDFIDLVELTGCAVVTVQAGEYDLSTAAGRMTARVVGAVARGESEQKSERQRRKALQLAREGKIGGGGTRPFGFEKDRTTVREEEADLIREAAKRVLAGESIRGIVRDWNERGVPTSSGKTWMPTPLRRMLVSAHVAGLRSHHGVVTAKGTWEGILDEATHERLKGVLLHPSRVKYDGSSARRYLLTGFLQCGPCGAKLVARPKDDKRRAHVCATGPGFTGCGKIGALAKPLEAFVTESLFTAMSGPALESGLRAQEDDSAEAALMDTIRVAESRMEELAADYYGRRALTKPEFLAARDAIDGQLKQARRALGKLDRGSVLATIPSDRDAMRALWESRSLDWRRTLLSVLIEKIAVHPAVKGRNTFDPSRFQLIWIA